jgi:glycosyltransferase involved in cell wall biosynthesis
MTSILMILEATVGGIRRHVVDLLVGLDKKRYKVALIYSLSRADAGFKKAMVELAANGVDLHEVAMGRGIDPDMDFRALREILSIIRKTRPDIIHLHGAKAGAIGRGAAMLCGNRRIVYTPHGGSFHKFNGLRGRIYWAVEKSLGWISKTRYIGVSQHSCDQILQGLGAPPERVHLVYNGISAPDVLADRPGQVYGEENQRNFKILFPAVFFEAKGHLEFLDALHRSKSKLHPAIRIFLAGDGPLKHEIEQRIQSYHLDQQILMVGFIEDLGPWYQGCDLVILPSRDEAFGYVILEAMYFGKPVAAARVGGLKEIIRENETGLFFEEDAWSDIAGVLNSYAGATAELSELGHNGQEFARTNFGLERMIDETCAVYRETGKKESD